MNCEGPTLTTSKYISSRPFGTDISGRVDGKQWASIACMFCFHSELVVCFKRKAEAAAILQSDLAACRGRIFSTYFSVNCLLHISINYTENVTDLYAHAQTVDTRCSSPIFQVPGYEASNPSSHDRLFCLAFSTLTQTVLTCTVGSTEYKGHLLNGI